MQAINLKFNIETLEDFHIGTGLDCAGLYDDGQVKDKDGNPYINPETLKGLLKQSCKEVNKALHNKYENEFDELFDFRNLGSLDLIIKYNGCNHNNPFIIHTFTAIDEKTGTGKEGTLRDIEFGSKGCKFEVELHFEMKNDKMKDTVEKFLTLGIKNLKWMGGHRRRGFGAIQCTAPTATTNSTSLTSLTNSTKFRIFLELLDDVCFAGAGQSGNIINSNDYITGTTALGMLRNPLLKSSSKGNSENLSFLDDGNVSVSNFYPIAKKWDEKVTSKVVIPAPASLRKTKGVDQFAEYYCDNRNEPNSLEIPHWALDAKPKDGEKKSFKNIVNQDTLIDDKDTDQDGASDKSISGEYLVFPNNEMDWKEAVFFKPKKNLIMRNHIEIELQSTKKKDGLFVQEMIEKGTIFVGEINFKDNIKNAEKFQIHLKDWLNGKFYFHAGRGGKALKVKALEKVSEQPKIKEIENNTHFSLTLLSDVLLYDENLMPETVIHPEYLNLKDKIKLVNYVASNRIHQSFTGLAGLRRFSDKVISKGSCFLYELEKQEYRTEVLSTFAELQKNGIGFKKDEGFGQVVINLSVHQFKKEKNKELESKFIYDFENPKLPNHLKESLEKKANLIAKARKFQVQYPKDSKTFINKIITYMEANVSDLDLEKEINHNIEKKTKASDNWTKFKDDIWKNTKEKDIIRFAHLLMKAEGKNGKGSK